MAGLTVLDHGGRVRRMTIESPMIFALQEAERAAARGEVPVGAVLVNGDSGEILARAGNQTVADSDPTAHAEMLVIRAAAAKSGAPRLQKVDLYVTLEPCAICAALYPSHGYVGSISGLMTRRAVASSMARGFFSKTLATTLRRSSVESRSAALAPC